MEGNDAAIAGESLYVVQHIVSSHPFGVVASHQIPHDDAELAREPGILTEAHPAMRRAHQVGVQIGVSFLDIIAVLFNGMTETAYVIVGVVANAMAFVDHTLIDFRILSNIVAYHEKRCFHPVLCQDVKNIWRRFGYGPVIEGQLYRPVVGSHTP